MADAPPPSPSPLKVHEDVALFREAVNFTAARTGFVPRLIEKDYFCTVLLAHLASADPRLVFKGGTCLAKVHAGFFRLSEDLDFAIPVPATASRKERRRQAEPTKSAVASVLPALPLFNVVEPLLGANDSAQYNGTFGYRSLLGNTEETIKVEVSFREPLLLSADLHPTRTLLLDPVAGDAMLLPVGVRCIAFLEAIAEKFRAAMTRREVAIRDYFDLDHAITTGTVDPRDAALVEQVRRKITIPGNESVNVRDDRLVQLKAQLDARLRPVLRPADYDRFDLARAFAAVARMAAHAR